MKIAISGASGFIGKHLVTYLSRQGYELILLGRDQQRLQTLFPKHLCYSYDKKEEALDGAQVFIHLAAALPQQQLSAAKFAEINVGLTEQLVNTAKKSGINCFVNFATLGWNDTDYSKTKLQAEEILKKFDKPAIVTLRLPAVYGDEFRGRLSILNRVPRLFLGIVFQTLASLRPTVNINRVCEATQWAAKQLETKEKIVSDRQKNNNVYNTFKLLVDYGFAISILILFWWLLIGIYIAVRLDSKGPGIFAQTRVGKNKTHFTCYKFRTMKLNTVSAGTHEVSADSVTKLGKFLRKTKLDELPQVINILKGQIGLVGPRPCLPIQSALLEQRMNLDVYDILPGITGLAQINGIDMSNPKELAMWDAKYLGLRCVPLDIKIIILTFLGRGSGDKTK